MKSRICILVFTSLVSLSSIASETPVVKAYNMDAIDGDEGESVIFRSGDGCRYFGTVKVTKIKSTFESILGPDIKSEINIDGKSCGEALEKVTFVPVYERSNKPRQLNLPIPAGTLFSLYDYSNSVTVKK